MSHRHDFVPLGVLMDFPDGKLRVRVIVRCRECGRKREIDVSKQVRKVIEVERGR